MSIPFGSIAALQADLLEQLPLARFRRRIYVGLARENIRQPLAHLLFPLAHLHRVNHVPRGNRKDRLDAFQSFEPNSGFELGTMLTTFLRQMDRSFSGWF